MADPEIDLLAIGRGTVTAPAGCGKTHLIAETLRRHDGALPILVLTHTNALRANDVETITCRAGESGEGSWGDGAIEEVVFPSGTLAFYAHGVLAWSSF